MSISEDDDEDARYRMNQTLLSEARQQIFDTNSLIHSLRYYTLGICKSEHDQQLGKLGVECLKAISSSFGGKIEARKKAPYIKFISELVQEC